MSPDERPPRGSRVTVRRFDSAADADRHELEFWLPMTEAERVLHVWRLSQELCLLRGDKSYEPGTSGSIPPRKTPPVS